MARVQLAAARAVFVVTLGWCVSYSTIGRARFAVGSTVQGTHDMRTRMHLFL